MLASRSLKRGTKVVSLSSISSSRRMRYRMRFVFFPFSLAACGSNSSVAVRKTHHQSGESDSEITETALTTRRKVEKRSKSGVKTKTYSSGSWPIARPKIAVRMQRLIRGIKCFPQMFVHKEEEEVEKEMEIGLPTDVKHVTHIGLDGLNTNNIVKTLDDVVDQAKTAPLPIISLDEFETAMDAQARAPLAV